MSNDSIKIRFSLITMRWLPEAYHTSVIQYWIKSRIACRSSFGLLHRFRFPHLSYFNPFFEFNDSPVYTLYYVTRNSRCKRTNRWMLRFPRFWRIKIRKQAFDSTFRCTLTSVCPCMCVLVCKKGGKIRYRVSLYSTFIRNSCKEDSLLRSLILSFLYLC